MSDLLALAVAAGGGLDRWPSYRTVSLELSVGGALWDLKGQAALFVNATHEADIHEQRATLGRFGSPGQRIRFTPDLLILEGEGGYVIDVRDNPRSAFAGHANEKRHPGTNSTPPISTDMRSGLI
jgi:hypothetical protein